MNIILLDKAEIQDDNVLLTDRRAEHLVKVLRVREGDWVRVGQVGGNMGRGRVLRLKKKFPFAAELKLELTEPPAAPPEIDLLLALPRPIMLRRILSQAAALGVGAFHLLHSRRVEKSFWESSLLEPEEYTSHLRQGLEQAAVDTRLPEVFFHRRFKPFIEDTFPKMRKRYEHCVLAHPEGETRLADLLPGTAGQILLAIGPEGGWVEYEVERFAEQGFASCSVGKRILKVDTAVVALHGQVSALKG